MKWLALTVVLGVSASALAAPALSPERIAADIQADGANVVVERLWNSGDYDRVLSHMDTGAEAWIMLAPKLAPGTDAGSAEELAISLAYALPKNPKAVLSVLDPASKVIAPGDVCGVPFIEGTVRNIPAYVRRATAAVSRVASPALQSRKAACLTALKKP